MWMQKLRAFVAGRKRQDADLNDELRFHLEREIEQNIAGGMSAGEARRQAFIAFGGVTQTRESLREVHRGRVLDSLLQDTRYALRVLRKSPAFTLVAVMTLALGIGANTAIFSLIDAIVFRSMPIPAPGALMLLKWQAKHPPETYNYRDFGDCQDQLDEASTGCSLPLPFFHELRSKTTVFENLAAYAFSGQADMSGNGPARMVRNEFVSGMYFQTLGVRAHLGRLLVEGDDAPDAPPVAVLNYSFWQTDFGGSHSVIGKTIKLNGTPFTIVGVAERRFDALTLTNKFDLWVPLAKRPAIVPRWKARGDQMDSFWLLMIARVKPDVTVARAQAAVSLIFRDATLQGEHPVFKPEHEPAIRLAPAARELGGSQRDTLRPLYIMMLCVGVVLLIACANVAGLLLVRSAGRRREIAVRLALGASRARLVRQLLTESVLLSLAGGALGLLMAIWGARALLALVTAGSWNPPVFSTQLDWRVLAFTAGTSVLTGIVFGLAPALRGSDVGLSSSLKAGEAGFDLRAHGLQGRVSPGGILVAVQVALAMVVLVTAGLLVRTLSNLKSQNPGFETSGLLLFAIDPGLAGYKGAQLDNLYLDLQEKFAALPGVQSATYSWMPLLGGGLNTTSIHRPGTPVDSKDLINADVVAVGPRFFSTLQIPVLAGRDFISADYVAAAANSDGKNSGAPTPAIVNQAFAREYFPGGQPLGKMFGDSIARFRGEANDPGYQIVGVVGDAKVYKLRRAIKPGFYVPRIGGDAFFELRTAGDPMAVLPAIRGIVSRENDDLALFRISTQDEAIDRQLLNERMTAQLSSFFGLLALVLACLGLYGLLSYDVTRRTREIGIRMAIGAQSHNVVRLVLGKTMMLIALGAMAGTAAAVAVTRLLTSVLYGVKAGDPATLLASAMLLAVVALLACYIPARRATRVDPLVALRYE